MARWLPRIILYLSLAFFIWYLYQMDYLVLQELDIRPIWMILSLVFLFLGFIISSLSWGYALGVHGYAIGWRKSIISHGLPVFAKYIPGKVWVILGRASYVADEELPLKAASMVSLKEQLIYLSWGLIISVLPVFFFVGNMLFGLLILISAMGISFILFSPHFHRLLLKLLSRIKKKQIDIPLIKIHEALRISWVVVLYWISWTVAFYLLLVAVYPAETLFFMAFAFPVSVTYGVLAIFMPGGIGVREGILTAFLVAGGMALDNAVTISVLSRLWFVAGEVFMFSLSFLLKVSGKAADYPEYPSTWQKAGPENR